MRGQAIAGGALVKPAFSLFYSTPALADKRRARVVSVGSIQVRLTNKTSQRIYKTLKYASSLRAVTTPAPVGPGREKRPLAQAACTCALKLTSYNVRWFICYLATAHGYSAAPVLAAVAHGCRMKPFA